MKSQCTKAHCKTAAGIDGRPAMIVCARDVKKKRQKKTVKGLDTPAKKSKYQEIYEDSDSDSSLLSVNELSDDEIDDNPREQLFEFWKSVSLPVPENDVKGKWFCAIYENGCRKSLYIGRAMKRFLEDGDGPVTALELDCLMPRVGNDCILEGYPPGQGDPYMFPIEDVLGGFLAVQPAPQKKWRVEDIYKMEAFYEKVKDANRKEWLQQFRLEGSS